MWKSNPIHLEDLQCIVADENIPWHELNGKTVLVTGATGLIGSNIINALLYYGEGAEIPPHVLAFVRNKEKAERVFAEQLTEHADVLSFVVGDICDHVEIPGAVDYVIHAASDTASRSFVERPVEIIRTAVNGTWNMLELAREKQVKSFVYLSSMEAYGSPTEERMLTEDAPAYFDSSAVRSCYPESKRMCEMSTAAYAAEYQVPAKCIRLAQTFGPGIAQSDVRVFVDFSRKALTGEDIVLATKGDSQRMYLYTADAVRAILTVLLRGESGKCYNAANPDTYCSVLEMAQLVSRLFSEGRTKVVFSTDPHDAEKYPPGHKLKLDVSKLASLGWCAYTALPDMYLRMIQGMEK